MRRARLIGKHKIYPTITIEFFETGKYLIYIEGQPPFFRSGLTFEQVQEILINDNYIVEVEEKPILP